MICHRFRPQQMMIGVNTADTSEIAAIDKRLAELKVEKEQLLYRKQVILGQLRLELIQVIISCLGHKVIILFESLRANYSSDP